MLFYRLLIHCNESGGKHLTIIEAETMNEILEVLAQPIPSYIDGMICFPFYDDIDIPTEILKNGTKEPFDWIGVNVHGLIASIDKKVEPNTPIKIYDKSVAVLVLRKGLSDRYGLITGYGVIHKKLSALARFLT